MTSHVQCIAVSPGTAALFFPEFDKDVLSIIQSYISIHVDVNFLKTLLSALWFSNYVGGDIRSGEYHHYHHIKSLFQSEGLAPDNWSKVTNLIRAYPICTDVNTFVVKGSEDKSYINGGMVIHDRKPFVSFISNQPLISIYDFFITSAALARTLEDRDSWIFIDSIKHVIDGGRSTLHFIVRFSR